MEIVKEYTNGEVTIVWKPEMCTHSGVCARGLPHVFQPKDKPWIKQHADNTQMLMAQIDKCPSGALSYYLNSQTSNERSLPE